MHDAAAQMTASAKNRARLSFTTSEVVFSVLNLQHE